MPFNKIQSAGFDLTDNYAFTGTVSGAGDPSFVKTGALQSTTDAGDYSIDSVFSATYMNYFVTFKVAIAGANIAGPKGAAIGAVLGAGMDFSGLAKDAAKFA